MTKKKDLTQGIDLRGDHALFIEAKHFVPNDWELDVEVKEKLKGCEPTFFRVINDGYEESGHGWIENGEIIQWG